MNVARTLKRAIRQHQKGYPQDARATCHKVLRFAPRNAEAHHLMGLFCKDSGDYDAAEQHLTKAIGLQPSIGDFHNSLGATLALAGRPADAAASFQRALQLNPRHLDARTNLARALEESGQLDAAAEAWRQISQSQPGQLGPRYQLGNLCYALGEFDEAAACFQAVLAVRPGHADSLNNLGVTQLARGDFAAAEATLRQAVAVAPARASAHANLGAALAAQGQVEAPIACYEQALLLEPGYTEAAIKLARHLSELGRFDEAESTFRGLLRGDPEHAEAAAGLAAILERRGQLDEALAAVAPALHRAPRSANLAHIYGTLCRRTGHPEEALALLEPMLQGPLARPERALLVRQLGHLLDAVGRCDEAFDAWLEAGRLWGQSFDVEGWFRTVDAVIAATPAGALEPPRQGFAGPTPVLIVGMPRSGTSLVEQILSRHPRVTPAGELEDLRLMGERVQGLTGEAWPGGMARLGADGFEQLGGIYLGRLREFADEGLVTDKMPGNFQRLGLAARALPGVKVIHCRRAPMDVALSCLRQDFAAYSWSHRPEDIAAWYAGYTRLMNHWRDTLPVPLYEVDYEALVTNPEAEIPALVAACGLTWDAACLAPHESDRVVHTASYAQVREPIYTRSVGRSQAYAGRLAAFDEALEGYLG
jgi:tetratricopeptide (TPR) repeat protein